jgi:hypothetical protein
MKRIKIFLCVVALATTAIAQTPADSLQALADTSWKKGGFTSLSFTQVSLSNWAAGGEEAFSGVVQLGLFANYAKDKTAWDNSLDLAYGLIKSGDADPRKNEDKLELNSKYGYKAFGKFFYSGLLNFRSQFMAGYNYPDDSTVVSKFAAPAYITIALGLDYKPNDYFSAFISPATGKYTLVTDQKLSDAGAYGVDSGKTVRPEFGAYFRAKFQKDLATNFNLSTTLNLFNNYTDKNTANQGNVDVNWETALTLKAGKLITTTLFTNLIYDHDITLPTYETIAGVKTITGSGPKTQFKEVFGIGLSYKF